uniref:GRAM domain containing 2A n=2 Tax=Galliformes TaxID=8976 RepID=A0A8C2T4S2_COTJA
MESEPPSFLWQLFRQLVAIAGNVCGTVLSRVELGLVSSPQCSYLLLLLTVLLSSVADCQQVQLPVPQAVQGHPDGGERAERWAAQRGVGQELWGCRALTPLCSTVCSCALQRDILIQGRLYISPNWLCFYANLFGKDIKVVIPVVSVQLIKKHKTARLLPNGLAITTTASRKYIFVSLISRDSVYDVLRRVCTHLQVSSKKSLSLKELTEEPDAVSLEVIVPEGKWRKVSPASLSLSLPDADYQCIHRTSVSSLSAKESFTSEEPLASESAINTEEELEAEQGCVAELRPSDYQLLKIFIVLICLLVVSSSYLAFRIFRLEQQLCSLNRDYLSRGHRR